MLRVEIDPGAGFCFGVDEVIKTAENRLRAGEVLYGLGDMVHNAAEVERLKKLGLRTINHEELRTLSPGKVLFRAHGEPPATYQLARDRGVEIIDGTCPIVSRLQKKIRKAYEEMDPETDQLVIFGKSDHPETIGLLGQVNGDALVVNTPEDITAIDPDKRVRLFSQTTMDPESFKEVEKALGKLLQKNAKTGRIMHFKSDCTICGQMKKRKPGLSAFARKYDVMLFVSGLNSSNGKMLYEYCLSINPNTYWISSAEEIQGQWFDGYKSIGISGATSTSRQQLESVQEEVLNLT